LLVCADAEFSGDLEAQSSAQLEDIGSLSLAYELEIN
jgi:hypothetical protein